MLVVSVNGRPVQSVLDWEARLLDARTGEPLMLVVSESGRERQVRVATEDLPSIAAARVSALDEFELITLTPAVRAERALASERGALIVGLTPAAQRIGLREGDLIVQINRTEVRSAEEAADVLRRLASARAPVRLTLERRGTYASVSFYFGG
jgi:serine protease Do